MNPTYPIIIQHSVPNTPKNKYNHIKCEISKCAYTLKNKHDGCYVACKAGIVSSCTYWDIINPFRFFIAIEREKRKENDSKSNM